MNRVEQESFKENVEKGLTDFPKHLSSKFIYDQKGDKLFQDIMAMPEYYLTNCEYEIIETYTKELAKLFCEEGDVDLIELGAGDGKKTMVLLRYIAEKKYAVTYKPTDISSTILDALTADLTKEIPTLKVEAETGEYFEVLSKLKQYNKKRKVILMMGSNIGNLLHPEAIDFLTRLKDSMSTEDLLFMGFDQKKHPQTIWNAYNDQAGITTDFNRNLLVRINHEFGGNFQPEKFFHWESYDPETGTAKSFLLATEEMEVEIKKLDLKVHFDRWETIHCEISQKYTDEVVGWLAKESGLQIVTSFTDKKAYYKNYIFKRIQ